MYFDNGVCDNICGISKFADRTTFNCLKCDENCQNCNGIEST